VPTQRNFRCVGMGASPLITSQINSTNLNIGIALSLPRSTDAAILFLVDRTLSPIYKPRAPSRIHSSGDMTV
jgi:hypothetical protein